MEFPLPVFLCLLERAEAPRALRTWLLSKLRRLDNVLVFLAVAALCYWGQLAHPYLLADNRHYAFYLHRRLLSCAPLRPLLAAGCGVGGVCLFQELRACRGGVWALGYLLAAALVLLPTPLLEPRYFSLPLLVAALHAPPTAPSASASSSSSSSSSGDTPMAAASALQGVGVGGLLQLLCMLAGSVLAVHVFLFRPFLWPDGSSARFLF